MSNFENATELIETNLEAYATGKIDFFPGILAEVVEFLAIMPLGVAPPLIAKGVTHFVPPLHDGVGVVLFPQSLGMIEERAKRRALHVSGTFESGEMGEGRIDVDELDHGL